MRKDLEHFIFEINQNLNKTIFVIILLLFILYFHSTHFYSILSEIIKNWKRLQIQKNPNTLRIIKKKNNQILPCNSSRLFKNPQSHQN